jgi:hypothetical protein
MRRGLHRWLGRAAAAATGVAIASHACAENHALILWIGQYREPVSELPGIDIDAKNARAIALAMGVPDGNIAEAKNEQLTLQGIADTIDALTQRIKPGDKVFLYYSGHGSQRQNNSGTAKKCSEGLVAHDVRLYYDRELEVALRRLGEKASQLVMMNDSCFSGGASEKAFGASRARAPRWVPKAVPPSLLKAAATTAGNAEGYECGQAVNQRPLAKSLDGVVRAGARLLYIAAAADNEVSFASSQGSLATLAWTECMGDPATDADRSGMITGEELRACAQARVNRRTDVRQTIALGSGDSQLAVGFAPQAPLSAVSAPSGAAAPDGAKALVNLRHGSDVSYRIDMTPTKRKLRIRQDELDFTVKTNREGYLYLLQVGSDRKTFNLLFPNQMDSDNRVGVGAHRFPRLAWAVRAAGPAGTSHLIALVSPVPKDFSRGMDISGIFAVAPITGLATKNLIVEATGASPGGNGRYGTSEVVAIEEVP